jgi:hypothetical protein
MNKELALLAEIKQPSPITETKIAEFGDEEENAISESIKWAWLHRRIQRMSQRRAAELCGMSASHFSNMVNGDKYLPPQKMNQFEWVVGNTAVSQTIDKFRGVRNSEIVRQVSQIVAENMTRAA